MAPRQARDEDPRKQVCVLAQARHRQRRGEPLEQGREVAPMLIALAGEDGERDTAHQFGVPAQLRLRHGAAGPAHGAVQEPL